MNLQLRFFLVLALLAVMRPAMALDVFACEPEWGALAKELGGDAVSVYTATSALQDPHRIQARPSLLAKARRAQLVVCTGAELEIGWLPLVLRQSGNRAIQPGRPGYFEAAAYVTMLEVPTALDRAAGDVHARGNPHIQTDPRNIGKVAAALAQRLGELDPGHAADYQARYQDFSRRWQSAIQTWQAQAKPLRGIYIVAHHRGWIYLENWLGLHEIAELEPKPGVEPTAAHLQEVLKRLQGTPARLVIRTAYEDDHVSNWLAGRAGIPAVMLPFTVGGSDRAGDLFGLFDDTVQRLLQAVQ